GEHVAGFDVQVEGEFVAAPWPRGLAGDEGGDELPSGGWLGRAGRGGRGAGAAGSSAQMPAAVMSWSRAASMAVVKLARSGLAPGRVWMASVIAMRSSW